MRAAGPVDIALFAALTMMWGSSYLFIKIALADFTPIEMLFWRLMLSISILFVLQRHSGHRLPRTWRLWTVIFAAGCAGYVGPFFLMAWAVISVPTSTVAILIGTTPIFTALLAALFLDNEGLTGTRALGIAVGFAGVLVLLGGVSLGELSHNLLPNLALLGAATGFAVTAILVRKLHILPTRVTALGINIGAATVTAPLALTFGDPFDAWPRLESALAVAVLGIFPSAVATLCLVTLIRRAGAGFTAHVNYATPLVGTLLGVLVLDESLQHGDLAGLGLILAGIWISSRQKAPAPKPHSP